MTKMERAIEALEALPLERQDEIADLILELATGAQDAGEPAMTPEQIEESLRRAADFRPADPDRVKQLLARLA